MEGVRGMVGVKRRKISESSESQVDLRYFSVLFYSYDSNQPLHKKEKSSKKEKNRKAAIE